MGAGALAACGKKKRSLSDPVIEAGTSGESLASQISPARTVREEPVMEGEEDDVIGSKEDSESRDGRFMVYWTTITKSSTTTVYTSTSTLASITCTPSGFTVATVACQPLTGKKK